MSRALIGGIFIGGFFVLGAANAISTGITGSPLVGDSSLPVADSAPHVPVTGSWAAPITKPVTTAWKTPGSQWASGYHTGIDMAAATGTEVYAASGGTVITSGWGGPYGNQIVIQHGPKLYTQYAHLSARHVQAGDRVNPGDLIGLVGSTGTKSSGPHLHFEVRTGPEYGSDINPSVFLARQGIHL